jgi:hypothetical protein
MEGKQYVLSNVTAIRIMLAAMAGCRSGKGRKVLERAITHVLFVVVLQR